MQPEHGVLVFMLILLLAVLWVCRLIEKRVRTYHLRDVHARRMMRVYGFSTKQVVRPRWIAQEVEDANESADEKRESVSTS